MYSFNFLFSFSTRNVEVSFNVIKGSYGGHELHVLPVWRSAKLRRVVAVSDLPMIVDMTLGNQKFVMDAKALASKKKKYANLRRVLFAYKWKSKVTKRKIDASDRIGKDFVISSLLALNPTISDELLQSNVSLSKKVQILCAIYNLCY